MITSGVQVPIEGIADHKTKQALRALTDMLHSSTQERTGTLANLPRNLTPTQAGAIYYATDFDRRYRWTGTSWEDDWESPARKAVVWFDGGPDPSAGWARADGRTVVISASDGSQRRYQTPTVDPLNGMVPWVRL